jgi:hypothetical protein
MANRGPVVLSIDEVEILLDLLGRPEKDESYEKTSLRTKLHALLLELQHGAVQAA